MKTPHYSNKALGQSTLRVGDDSRWLIFRPQDASPSEEFSTLRPLDLKDTKGTHTLTNEKIAHFKQMLLDEKTRLDGERQQYAQDSRTEGADDAAGELSHSDSNDPADEATNLYDRDRDQAAIENMDRMLGKVNRALAKIDEGTYGLSDIDGTPIPEARLEALPYAATTVEQDDQI